MKNLQFSVLANAFDTVATRAKMLADSFVVDTDFDENELRQLLLASENFRKAAAKLELIADTPGGDKKTLLGIESLSHHLDSYLECVKNDKQSLVTLVDIGEHAVTFAESVTTGNPVRAHTSITNIATTLGTSLVLPIVPKYRPPASSAEIPIAPISREGVSVEPLLPGDAVVDDTMDEKAIGEQDAAPTVQTYAHIEIASSMHVDEEKELRVGIDPQQQANVVGEAMTIAGGYPFDITVTVVAQEFVHAPNESWSNVLTATEQMPNPSVTLHVTPRSQTPLAEMDRRTIGVQYSMGAHFLGYASVLVNVHPTGVQLTSGRTSTAQGVVTTYPKTSAFDLTIIISAFSDGSGRLNWTFLSPHFAISTDPITSTIGKAPEKFAEGLIQLINTAHDVDQALNRINSAPGDIADVMPQQFASVWRRLHEAIPDRIPAVLIVSDDPYVPWELAKVVELFDASAPALLGAQADVGRWILKRQLTLPPPLDLDLLPMVEVTALYDTTAGWERLKHAEEEGRTLAKLYGATHVDATDNAIIDCLKTAKPPAKTLHFALHGVYDAATQVDGLIMVDGATLTPNEIKWVAAKNHPFVFLNVCQVGAGKQTLGQPAGMPAAFLYANARGVIAPLWNVDDGEAKQLALRFYKGLNKLESPAALLRAERKRRPTSPTALAYVYFGNPRSRTTGPIKVPVASGA